MRLLHDYNYKELSEIDYNFYFDIEKLKIIIGFLEHYQVDDGVICTLHELQGIFEQHFKEFDCVFGRINECIVPPEGKEEIPELVYSHDIV